jgi:alkylated DNA repair protein alkB family protein 8
MSTPSGEPTEQLGSAVPAAAAASSSSTQAQPKRRQRVESAHVAASDECAAAQFEAQHVHEVYSSIAQKFSDTRFKPWPNVLEFVLATPPGSILIDVGCGNGKNLGRLDKSAGILEIGCDRSVELLRIAAQRQLPVVACDMLQLPFRAGVADRVICIAVLHHLSTAERRLEALRQMFRLLRPGTGRMLVYVWSTEFAKSEIAKGRADPSVLGGEAESAARDERSEGACTSSGVKTQQQQDEKPAAASAAAAVAVAAPKQEGADVFVSFATRSNAHGDALLDSSIAPGRYYHLFEEGEIEALCRQIGPHAEIAKSWFDHENWAVEVAHRGS